MSKWILVFAMFGALFDARAARSEEADLVLRNCTVITMEKNAPQASAVALKGEKIAFVGQEEGLASWIGKRTKVLDLKGAFVYPGFIDSHAHIVSLGSFRLEIDLEGTSDVASIAKKVKERVAKSKKGTWIQGRGWDQNDWPVKEFPTTADLDSVSPDNPVVLERVDGHAYWVNTAALKIAEISADTKDPDGGKIVRDEKGNPTGILVDQATGLIDAKLKALAQPEIIQRTKIALDESARKGITMIDDAGSQAGEIEAWKTMAQNNQLPVRIFSMVWMPSEFGETYLKTGPQQFGPYLNMRSLKMVLDGALGSRGAAMLEPYSDDPKNSGLLMWKEEDMLRVLQAAKKAGIQVGIHAIGDRANRMVLDAYEKVGVKGLRWRIEHAQVLSLPDLPRLAQLDVIASMQPTHATSDGPWATDRVGPERIKGGYAWRTLLDKGTRIAGGSDAPVEDINPLWGIYSAITRKDHQGKPDGGWHPEQLVTREEALRMFTIDAAYTAFHENELGSIRPGKWADIVVLPANLLKTDPKNMIDMKVIYTIVGGKIRYSAGQ